MYNGHGTLLEYQTVLLTGYQKCVPQDPNRFGIKPALGQLSGGNKDLILGIVRAKSTVSEQSGVKSRPVSANKVRV